MTNVLAVTGPASVAALEYFTADQVALIKRTICRDATDDELKLFLYQCARTGLDPFDKQIYFRKFPGYNGKPSTIAIITGIDGYRLTADRTKAYEGQDGPLWCGNDGVWVDVWLSSDPPAAAKVGVYKTGCRTAFFAVARWAEYFPTNEKEQFMWRRMPANQLAKCAEALALRKAFPKELSGIYTQDEMAQAYETPTYTPPPPAKPATETRPPVKATPPPKAPTAAAAAPAPAAATTTPAAPAAPPAAEQGPMIDNPMRVAAIATVRRLILDKPPGGLEWHAKHGEAWIVKYFGVRRPIDMTLGQARDAEVLLRAIMRGADDEHAEYKRLLEMFHAEQRVLTGETER